MRTKVIIASSGFVAGAVAVALLLRPSHSLHRGPELAVPDRIPPAARAVIATKMSRHDEQMPALVSRVVVLDYDGVARAAGEIFDEPRLARPLTGDELNGLLHERFFVLQDQLLAAARSLVTAAADNDSGHMAAAFGELTRTCVECHAVYLNGQP